MKLSGYDYVSAAITLSSILGILFLAKAFFYFCFAMDTDHSRAKRISDIKVALGAILGGLFFLAPMMLLETVAPTTAILDKDGNEVKMPMKWGTLRQDDFNQLRRSGYMVDTSFDFRQSILVNFSFFGEGKRIHNTRIILTVAAGSKAHDHFLIQKSAGIPVGKGLPKEVSAPWDLSRARLVQNIQESVWGELNRTVEANQQQLSGLFDPQDTGQVEKLRSVIASAMTLFLASNGLAIKDCTFVVL